MNDDNSFDTVDFFIGDFDNFQQYWKQNTDDEMHKDNSSSKHEHVHLKIKKVDNLPREYDLEYYSGRNNNTKLGKQRWVFIKNKDGSHCIEIDGDERLEISMTESGFESSDSQLKLDCDRLYIKGLHPSIKQEEVPYKLLRCRYFDGWIQYPLSDDPENIHDQRSLRIHDQGAMVEIDLPGIEYTVELTQLVFAHKIEIMKLAIYDMALADVDINSDSISYTWTNPSAKRIGINLRKIISGWTLIEDGYINSTVLNKSKQ